MLWWVVVLHGALVAASLERKNVLFLAVDDMRPNIGAYVSDPSLQSLTHTPHMDHLAATALTFERAYVQYSFCAPSRNSFMSGRRPDTTRVWNFNDHFREPDRGPHWVALPQYFKKHGYLTIGGGKLYHPGVPPKNDEPLSWTPGYHYFCPECGWSGDGPANGAFHCLNADHKTSSACVANTTKNETNPKLQLEDQRIRDNCIEHLRNASQTVGPGKAFPNFFVGCGFHKPHVPWIVPHEFFDLLPEADQIPLAKDVYAPIGMPDPAWHFPADVKGFHIPFNGTCDPHRSRQYRRAYYAAMSYQDDNIGRVLTELETLGLAEDTVVILFGDHGWQLGEHATWAKMTNFELGVHIPLFIRAPWKTKSVGKRTRVLAEAVDFYPTLAALANLPDPKTDGPGSAGINGTSLAPVFDDPTDTSCKSAAYSQFAKESTFSIWPTPYPLNKTHIMGYSVRVDQPMDLRYTVWFGFDDVRIVPKINDVLGTELYDFTGYPAFDGDWPAHNVNVINHTKYRRFVPGLHRLILDYIQLGK